MWATHKSRRLILGGCKQGMLHLNAACMHKIWASWQISSSQLPLLKSFCCAGIFLCVSFIPSTDIDFGV